MDSTKYNLRNPAVKRIMQVCFSVADRSWTVHVLMRLRLFACNLAGDARDPARDQRRDHGRGAGGSFQLNPALIPVYHLKRWLIVLMLTCRTIYLSGILLFVAPQTQSLR